MSLLMAPIYKVEFVIVSILILELHVTMGLGNFSKIEEVDMDGESAQFVRETIASDGIVIFSKTHCPYCKMAKQVFDSISYKYTVVELDKREDGSEIQSILAKMTGSRTVPRVFIKGQFVGGGVEIKKLHESGGLLTMLDDLK